MSANREKTRPLPPRGAALAVLLTALALLVPAGAQAAPTWLPWQDILPAGARGSTSGASRIDPVSMAMDGQSNAVVVWATDERTGGIRTADRPAGGNWSAPQNLSVATPTSGKPDVASNAHGDVVAAWSQYVPISNTYSIQTATRSAGGSWSQPYDFSLAMPAQAAPKVAIDAEGNAAVSWSQREPNVGQFIKAATRSAGAGWSTPETLSRGFKPQLALDGQGTAIAIWLGQGLNTIEVATRPLGEGWSASQVIATTSVGFADPNVAVNARGDAVAVWHRVVRIGTDNNVTGNSAQNNQTPQAATRPAGSVNWSSPQDLALTPPDSSAESDFKSPPAVAVDPEGNAVAVWQTFNSAGFLGLGPGTDDVVLAAVRPSAGGGVRDGWSDPKRLSGEGQNATDPRVAVNEHGDAVAVWTRHNGGSGVVQSASRPAASDWSNLKEISDSSQIGTTGVNGARFPQVAVDPQGNAIAAWTLNAQQAPCPGDCRPELYMPTAVQAAGYDAAGPPLHDVSVPASGTVGEPLSFSAHPGVDVWSPPSSAPSWSFDGDGSSATGESVSHTYPAAGTYVVAVTSTDSRGNASTERRTVVITDTPAGAGGGTGGSGSVVPPAGLVGALPPAVLSSPLASGDLAAALAAERLRATGLRNCLGRVARRERAQRRQARLLSAGPRAIALRQITRRAQRGRGRCLLRFGRTPGRVRGLAARATGPGTIALTFLAAGTDHALPPAARRYVVKQSLRPISTQADFRAAQVLCSGSCRFPRAVLGERESLTITDLKPHRTYYYAVLARDNVSGRPGARSETISIKTR